MLNFCTLFDSGYLLRGLTLYYSLLDSCSDFKLYVLAFDDMCYDILKSLNLSNVELISLNQFEDEELREVKKSRTRQEYCWTCTPSLILYTLKKYNLDICTYLDADLYFFSSPQSLLDELEDKDVLITEHRYTKRYDQTELSGKYCVQFMSFKSTEKALNVLGWWREKCNDWCYARAEDGKFGDQKYLDDWLDRFDCVHSLRHEGGGVAPWNVQRYKFSTASNDGKQIRRRDDGRVFELVFYHFHGMQFFSDNTVYFGGYKLSNGVKTGIYFRYVCDYFDRYKEVSEKYSEISLHDRENSGYTPISASRIVKNYIKEFLSELLSLLKAAFGINMFKFFHKNKNVNSITRIVR